MQWGAMGMYKRRCRIHGGKGIKGHRIAHGGTGKGICLLGTSQHVKRFHFFKFYPSLIVKITKTSRTRNVMVPPITTYVLASVKQNVRLLVSKI